MPPETEPAQKPVNPQTPLYDRGERKDHKTLKLGDIPKESVKRVYPRKLPIGGDRHIDGTGIETGDGKTHMINARPAQVATVLGYKIPED